MKVTQLAIAPPPDSERGSDVHLSTLIKHILRGQDPAKYGGAPDDAARWKWEVGLGWEARVLAHSFFVGHTTKYQKALTVQCPRGLLHLTPDILDYTLKAVIEAKYTDLSTDQDITGDKYRSWRWQAMGYCKVVGWTKAIFASYHARGNYKEVRSATRWDQVVFAKPEIARNWAMLMNAWDEMVEGGGVTEPAIPPARVKSVPISWVRLNGEFS